MMLNGNVTSNSGRKRVERFWALHKASGGSQLLEGGCGTRIGR